MQTPVSIDETMLRKIADKTGGQYFRATDNASLAQIYAQIDKLERTTIEEERFTEYHQYYGWFVVARDGRVVLALARCAAPCCGGCRDRLAASPHVERIHLVWLALAVVVVLVRARAARRAARWRRSCRR